LGSRDKAIGLGVHNDAESDFVAFCVRLIALARRWSVPCLLISEGRAGIIVYQYGYTRVMALSITFMGGS